MAGSESGLGLGENPKKPIDCKSNPIAVDKYTNRVLNGAEGLYAMGPLVGDNFVRFIPNWPSLQPSTNRRKMIDDKTEGLCISSFSLCGSFDLRPSWNPEVNQKTSGIHY